jgi:beta-lactamase superfamily II metal-dependent hydrolase
MAPQTRSKDTPNVLRSKKGKIRIRMYRVGFGDCFLLSLPSTVKTKGNPFDHILIDCGVHSRGDIGTMEEVIENIKDETDGKLAIIIATHAHQDHISGFGKYASDFSKIEVGQIWLPWTWDDANPKARKFHENMDLVAKRLLQRVMALAISPERDAALLALENLQGNTKAIHGLKSGFGNRATKIRYLKSGRIIGLKDSSIPGLYVRILGPPESEEFLAKMNPPVDQRYLALEPDFAESVVKSPFAPKWIASADSKIKRLQASEEAQLSALAEFSMDLAFALDKARNNESLVVLFEFKNKHLLFAGDAQFGSWKWWIENEPDAQNILREINFLKIAHHGSENATPRMALEQIVDDDFASMVSTQSTPWESIPLTSLMNRLNEKTRSRLVRSDWLTVSGATNPLPGAGPSKPRDLAKGFSKGRLWFDYEIDL